MSDSIIEFLKQLDQGMLLVINGNHNGFLDFVMYWLSNRPVWIPLYLFLIGLLFKFYRRTAWWILLGAVLMILINDQASVHLFKNVFHRLRPCHEPVLEGILHLVKGKCGGPYGFVSSHAANTFALATFLYPFLKPRMKWLAVAMIVWAGAVSYSRIYLGVHYPGDVLGGIFLGSLVGWMMRTLTLRWINTRSSVPSSGQGPA